MTFIYLITVVVGTKKILLGLCDIRKKKTVYMHTSVSSCQWCHTQATLICDLYARRIVIGMIYRWLKVGIEGLALRSIETDVGVLLRSERKNIPTIVVPRL